MINLRSISLPDLAGYLSEELRKRGVDTILVGGACVTIYSKNLYQSYDLDYITYNDMNKVKKALKELGFLEKQKYFCHAECPWLVEFVSSPVAVGEEFIQKFNSVKTRFGTIKMLYPIDSVKDRLASFYHWDDRQGLEQALNICSEHVINLEELEDWSIREKHKDKFLIFKKLFNKSPSCKM